jgi:Cache domain
MPNATSTNRSTWFQTLLQYRSAARPAVIFYLLMLLVTMLLLILLILRNYYAGSTAQLYRTKTSEAELVAAIVDENLNLLMRLGKSYSTRPLLSRYVKDNSWGEAEMIVRDMLDNKIGIDRILLYDTNGIIRANYPDLNVVGGDRSSWQWFKEFKVQRTAYLSGIYQRAAKPRKNVLCIALPIMSDNKWTSDSTPIKTEQLIGILQFHIDPFFFHKWTTIDLGKGGVIYIVDQYGKIVYHPHIQSTDSIIDYSDNPIVSAVLSGKNGSSAYFNNKTQKHELAGFHRLDNYGWGVIVSQPSSEVFKIRNRIMMVLLIICSLIFFGTILLIINILHTLYIQQKASDDIKLKNADLQRMNSSLNEALENIKTLKGMLPICSYCKKIRNDTGYWQQIESYVRDHTDAEFSHSICPSCVRQFFPEMANEILNRRKSTDGEKPSTT